MPTPTAGAQAAEDIYLASKTRRGRLDFLNIKPDDKPVVLRFVTDVDGWLTAATHQFIPTKPKPADGGDKWPASMWAVCQNDRMFLLRDGQGNPTTEFEPGYGACWIHTHYAGQIDPKFKQDKSQPATQTYSICVVREAVTDPVTRKIKGFQDATIEFTDKDNKKHTVPKFLLVSQKFSNFYAPVKQAAYVDGMVANKDFLVDRTGNDYNIQAVNTTPDHAPGTDSWKVYEDALALMGVDLWQILLDHATPEHYARFFIPGDGEEAAPADGGTAEATGTETAPAADAEVSADELRDFASQLRGDKAGASA